MSAALLLGETLAAVVVAVMYAGGNALEDFAVTRAERDLKSLVDRAPRVAHRTGERGMEDVAIETVAVGDALLVRAGEIIPVDGVITSPIAMLDESALTGEPIPLNRRKGEAARSGTLNAGETFEMRVSATAGESTYAGIVRLVTAAQTAKAPFIRLADRYALLLLPLTLIVAGLAWLLSARPDPRTRGAGRGHPLPAHPGGTGCLHRRSSRRRHARGFSSRAVRRWRRSPARAPSCSTRPARSRWAERA